MPDIPADFDIRDILKKMRADLDEMRQTSPEPELTNIDADTAFTLGYETAIREIERVLEGPTLEIRAVEVPVAPADPKMFDGIDHNFPKEN